MDEIEYIASCMALSQDYPDSQLSQTRVRKAIVDAWGIPRGATVLEVGCGQGDLTAALAHAVGPEGHITACDLAAPDYGAPISIGESTDYLRRSPLGAQITFRLQYDVLAAETTFPIDQFDYVVFAHCSWYFDSLDRLRLTFRRIRAWAPYLCLSEWDLLPRMPDQLAHMLAVLIQGQVEAFRGESTANIRTPFTKEVCQGLLRESGWREMRQEPIDSSKLQDGQWEIEEAIESSIREAIAIGLPSRFAELLRTEVGLLQTMAATHGRTSLASFAILAERSGDEEEYGNTTS